MKNNILLITLRSDTGGGPLHMADLLSEFKKQDGFDFFVASPLDPPYGEAFKSLSKAHYSIPSGRFSFISFIGLLFFCRQHQISIIHSHGRGAGLYSRLMKLTGRTIIHTFHGVHLLPGLIGQLKTLIDYFLKYFTDYFICVSPSEKESALKSNIAINKKTKVIVNGIKLPPLDPHSITPKNNPHLKFGVLARLSYMKGLDLMIERLKAFQENNPEIKWSLQVAGDGEEQAFLSRKIKELAMEDFISLIGNTSSPFSFLKELDVYLSFSRWEGLPLSLLEAMALEKTCLVSDVIGNRDCVQDGKTGLLFKLESQISFEEKLLQIIQDPELRMNLGKNARKEIIQSFTAERMARQTLELYSSPLEIAP